MKKVIESVIFESVSELVGRFENAAVRVKSVEVGPGILVRFIVQQFNPYRVQVQMETHEDGVKVFSARLCIYPVIKIACALMIEQLGIEIKASSETGGWDTMAYKEMNRYVACWFDECVKGLHIEALKACAARKVIV